ncbi:MAG: hypothetical protein ACO1PB_17855 [Ramlibacter sp.]
MTEIVADVARRYGHLLQGRLFNRPRLLAGLARLGQWGGAAVACTPQEVKDVCLRTADFSNLAHADKLVAGPFVIGMDSGPVHARERQAASFPLSLADFGQLAADEARRRLPRLRARLDGSIDLVNDYLVHVAWAGLGGIFDPAARAAIEGVAPGIDRDAALQSLYFELRQVGGHLVVGGKTAPRPVQVRAAACAAALNERVERALPHIASAWQACPHAAASARRQAVGLMWVGHPAMVQAGAFVFQELRARPADYAALRCLVRDHGSQAYAEPAVREVVRGHVLECLRHRPPFPALPRLAPLGAELWLRQAGDEQRPATVVAAGKSVVVAIVAALHGAKWGDTYQPKEALALWRQGADDLPIFGVGARNCIAREQVLELLVSAIIGLLHLPELDYADRWWWRIRYDGPIITRLRLKVRP